MTFFWLLGMTAQLIWPFYLASGVVLAIAWHRRRAGHALDRQPLWHLVILLSTPLLLTLWASLTFGAERHARPGEWGWASALLTLLAVSIVCGAGWMLRRWRRQWLVAAPCVLAVVLATAMAWFIGAMAIADDWL